MMERTYIHEPCGNKLDVFEKDDTIIVHDCDYCETQRRNLKKLNVVGSEKGQINLEQKMMEYNAKALGMIFDKLGVRK
jgi:recombinational DNA repair protein RecR